MVKLDYLLSVLWLLSSRRRVTAEQIAEDLEVSVRTVYRYIDALSMSGVPVVAEAGHGGGYSLPSSFAGIPLFFDANELKAMAHGVLLAQQAHYPYSESLMRSLDKIRHRLNASQLEELERSSSGIEVDEPDKADGLQRVLDALDQAIVEGRTLSIGYAKAVGGPTSLRQIDPYGLLYRHGRWYVVAYCHSRESIRVFRGDRVSEVSPAGSVFVRPASFSAKAYLNGYLAVSEQHAGEKVQVILRANNELLSAICSQWFLKHSAEIERSEGEASLLMAEEAMLDYMPHMLLSFGKGVKVVQPLSLKEALVKLAKELVHYHES
ncbi:YafY family transcriptional regulator [Paenibacillus sp. 1011MAR3C5]|uniref:helix-turn-helix transcriptional regulator n=1 Tax=Paenibacillus sp. 1011MAR3C5 TaxID=1675787 RepID=UPI000E6CE2FD|nr:YafY family protein [Paenibacillus sp. 1011MAR3C5]RJE85159.1 YafY family transcriptional regulator [Paenibacillus sp. 1011MAR3C5]